MGTEKHPEEDAYNKFLDKNNGFSNAYTDQEVTNFYFNVDCDALFEAIDLFSGFFTCPLFLKDSVEREIQAVDNEHSKNLQSNSSRLSHFINSLALSEHPLHHFRRHTQRNWYIETGDKETLSIPNIRERAIAFHHAYYTASNMHLVILSSHRYEDLQQHIEALFSCMPIQEAESTVMSVAIWIWIHCRPLCTPPTYLVRCIELFLLAHWSYYISCFLFPPSSTRLWGTAVSC